MSDLQEIQAAIGPLTKADVATVMVQLEAVLSALPADAASDTDARLRHDMEVLLAGYNASRASGRGAPL
jgi:uncharacterized iron-regulated protein